MSESKIKDVSYMHKRIRQQSVVDQLQDLVKRADEGEIVGFLAITVDKNGTWRHFRDMFNADIPALLGFMSMMNHKLNRSLVGEDDEGDGCAG